MNGSRGKVVFDAAGASIGGAARFLRELDAWIDRNSILDGSVEVLGRGRQLSPSWLLARELAVRGPATKIALNNASFWGPRGERVVLLRNALHFAGRQELEDIGFRPSMELRAQTPVVRALAHRADRVVVPCVAMGERVVAHCPLLRGRVEVRGHPVTAPRDPLSTSAGRHSILVPVVPAPYKNLDRHVVDLLAAIGDQDLRVVVTATPAQLPLLHDLERVDFLGRLSAADLQPHWENARAVYYPTGLEAFGYPLAEARVMGRWILAQDSSQNREIAGRALCGYQAGNLDSLVHAVSLACEGDPIPDPAPNDPDSYFEWLTGGIS